VIETQPIGTFLKTIKGKKPTVLVDSSKKGLVPYIDISAVEHGTQRQFADPSGAKVVPAGSLVMVWDGARSGWVGLTRFTGALGSTLVALESPLDKRFLAAFLRAHFDDINSNPRGSGIPHVNPDVLRALEIPVVSEHDQRLIADLVDSINCKAVSAKDHLGAARTSIGRFNRAALAAVCSGRLTAEWRASNSPIQSASDLLSRHAADNPDLQVNPRRTKSAYGLAIPDQRNEFPVTWAYLRARELVQLKAILDIQDGNHGELYPRQSDFSTSGGVPFISAESINDTVAWREAPRLRDDVAQQLRIGFAQADDVILTHNATVGRVALLPHGSPDVVVSTSTTYYRLDRRVLLPEYLLLFMRSPFYQRQLAAVMEQTTRNQVPVTKQVELSIAVPPIEEQKQIVAVGVALMDASRSLQARIGRANLRVHRSSEAALAKAFRGELVNGHESGTH
jgi:type I restriction enzyme S subunit